MIIDQFFKNDKSNCEQNSNLTKNSEKATRSVVKSISWRVVGTIDTMIISWIITGKITLALSIGLIEVVTKMVLYFLHERVWNKINWGKQ